MTKQRRFSKWSLGFCAALAGPRVLQREGSRLVKSLAVVGLGLLTLLQLAGWLALLIWLTPVDLEWQGGFPPVLTLSKTEPDYDALEAHRSLGSTESKKFEGSQTTSLTASAYWTGFRGPERDGHYREMTIKTDWESEAPRLLWKQPVGGGYASFAVARGRAYTLEQRRDNEAVVAYDMSSGRELWSYDYPAHFDESMGGEGPRSTPAWAEGRVFAMGAVGDFVCLDALEGASLWRTNLLVARGGTNLYWGQSASPLPYDDVVVVVPGGGGEGRAIVAFEQESGAIRWESGTGEAVYSSPMLMVLGGERQLLTALKDRVLGLEPETGRLLWEFPWRVLQNNANIAQPVQLSANRFMLSAGYGTGSVAVEVEGQGEQWQARELWRTRRLKNKFSSSVFWDGYVYGLDEAVLTCLDAATGEIRWRDGRYGYGQLLLANGHLVVVGVGGELALVEATPVAWHEMGRMQVLTGKTWNHPALDQGFLLVRNAVEMACVDLRPSETAVLQ